MFKFLKSMFNKTVSKEKPLTSSSAIRDKFGNFQLTKILDGKNPTFSVEKQVSGNYKVSQTLEKTKTRIDYIVDTKGRVLSKEVTLGKGNRASSVIKGSKTLYSGDIVDGVSVTTPCLTSIQYKVPLYEEYNGFKNTYSKTSDGWVFKGSAPSNL